MLSLLTQPLGYAAVPVNTTDVVTGQHSMCAGGRLHNIAYTYNLGGQSFVDLDGDLSKGAQAGPKSPPT